MNLHTLQTSKTFHEKELAVLSLKPLEWGLLVFMTSLCVLQEFFQGLHIWYALATAGIEIGLEIAIVVAVFKIPKGTGRLLKATCSWLLISDVFYNFGLNILNLEMTKHGVTETVILGTFAFFLMFFALFFANHSYDQAWPIFRKVFPVGILLGSFLAYSTLAKLFNAQPMSGDVAFLAIRGILLLSVGVVLSFSSFTLVFSRKRWVLKIACGITALISCSMLLEYSSLTSQLQPNFAREIVWAFGLILLAGGVRELSSQPAELTRSFWDSNSISAKLVTLGLAFCLMIFFGWQVLAFFWPNQGGVPNINAILPFVFLVVAGTLAFRLLIRDLWQKPFLQLLNMVKQAQSKSSLEHGLGGFYSELRETLEQRCFLELLSDIQTKTRLATIAETSQKIVHDIRKPLTMVQAAISVLKTSDNRTDLLQRLQQVESGMEKTAQYVDSLLEDILSFQPDSALVLQAIQPEDIVDRSLQILASCRSDHGHIGIKTSFNHQHAIHADSNKCVRIVLNILFNALDAIGNKQGTIWIATEQIDHQGKDFVQFKIVNNGSTLDKKQLERIFDPFYTNAVSGQGFGLGLSVVDHLVGAHHGQVRCESDDETVSFIFMIPAMINSEKTDATPKRSTETKLENYGFKAQSPTLSSNVPEFA